MNIIIDYGLGNLESVYTAFEKLGIETKISSDKDEIASATSLILPGVGAFRDAIKALHETNLIPIIKEHVEKGKFLMGICLGMQLLYEKSYENGEYDGLGIIKGSVEKLEIDFNKINIYSHDPFNMAVKWKEQGGTFLHLVDLDGARNEEIINRKSIEKIAKNIGLPVQVGGGIRSEKRVEELLETGVERVIVGTIAIENKELLKKLVSKYKEKIVVSIDAKNGKVALRGWEVISEVNSLDLCLELEEIGVKTIVYTDISKDGMLQGPNFEIYEELSKKTSLNIIASGGVTSMDDIKKLNKMNLYGAIIGKALYNENLKLKDVIECLQKG